ncbi:MULTISPECIES: preprotein translocase subunit SecE [Mycolicibacter]|uniref:Protein translocase subunit SecE n=1 Tax=Mycolicibacter virginiensis TaxID=1795032 RepID=A0A9X7IPA2_9MYCO|nr:MULTISPECIES: preprotein translocase subunit SecE [Mycolicibacter]OBG40448.1 preprotein translocase subunit SecE [Mycolicibacter heraklionensis]OBJ33010.1 preprotein translocase subunit SecE [Mycolicibacter heraklionensis]PQM52977.1 preprotein translocase subunit SecE [Mycolicibacter virginiensis]ULP48271.1 preprotein translocase subunit SecE [Mycolicibacter virginiensis]
MTDELDRPDAAADGDSDAESGSSSRTAVVSRQVGDPLRPTGKRSRRRGAGGGGDDVESTATELDAEDAADAEKAKKKAKKKAEGPSRNPFVFVLNFLKQVVGELRKVIWPNRKQMVTYTAVVLAFLVFMVALVAGADFGFARLVLLVFGE